jgi:hypothetical protein
LCNRLLDYYSFVLKWAPLALWLISALKCYVTLRHTNDLRDNAVLQGAITVCVLHIYVLKCHLMLWLTGNLEFNGANTIRGIQLILVLALWRYVDFQTHCETSDTYIIFRINLLGYISIIIRLNSGDTFFHKNSSR